MRSIKLEQQQGFDESPMNVCLRQGKKLKMTTRLKKEAMEQGSLEFETDFECVDKENV